MRFLFLLFIMVPIIEIGIFIQVGDQIGLGATLFMVIATAIIGVNLLKRQGISTWNKIQLSLAQGQVPAAEMASAAQLLFAGALLLTPGFVTDGIGFSLLVPGVRDLISAALMKRWTLRAAGGQYHHYQTTFHQPMDDPQPASKKGRTIEGDFEDQSRQ